MMERRVWRVWSSSERRGVLGGLSSGGAEGWVLALVGGVGGSVSSVLLALAESVEEAVLSGDAEGLSVSLSHVRAAWRLGASCPVWESVSAEEAMSSLLGRPASPAELEAAEEALSFVWVDASRRWVVLPAGLTREGALERFVESLSAGEVSARRSSGLCPSERVSVACRRSG